MKEKEKNVFLAEVITVQLHCLMKQVLENFNYSFFNRKLVYFNRFLPLAVYFVRYYKEIVFLCLCSRH